MTKFTSSAISQIPVSTNNWDSTLFQYFDWKCTFSVCSFSNLHALLCEQFIPLSNICFLHNFWALRFRQQCRCFTCTSPTFGENLKLFLCSKLWPFIFQLHIATHTHILHFFTALTHLMLQCLHHSPHKGKTCTDELLDSSTNDIYISNKIPL
jgi:hypothetical protein